LSTYELAIKLDCYSNSFSLSVKSGLKKTITNRSPYGYRWGWPMTHWVTC